MCGSARPNFRTLKIKVFQLNILAISSDAPKTVSGIATVSADLAMQGAWEPVVVGAQRTRPKFFRYACMQWKWNLATVDVFTSKVLQAGWRRWLLHALLLKNSVSLARRVNSWYLKTPAALCRFIRLPWTSIKLETKVVGRSDWEDPIEFSLQVPEPEATPLKTVVSDWPQHHW